MSNGNASGSRDLGPVIVDVEGLVLSPQEKQRLNHPLVGGVILFARNFKNRQQLATLCQDIKRASAKPLLIAVDHEGGRVQRFRDDGFTAIPGMADIGKVWAQDPHKARRLAADAAYVMAAELRACGLDMTFAPVLDLDYGVSQVIGSRALHQDPEVVTALAWSVSYGLRLAGMAACGKHFPGHGAVREDSHTAIPRDGRTLDEILAQDAAPYRWLGDLVLPAVMPAHVIYPAVDDQPAGFSKRWLQQVLRQQLAYEGVVFSDDLTMEAAAVAGDIQDRSRAALEAGCDMVLVCNRPDLADALLSQLTDCSSAASAARRQRLLPQLPALSWEALQQTSSYRHARARLQSEKLSG